MMNHPHFVISIDIEDSCADGSPAKLLGIETDGPVSMYKTSCNPRPETANTSKSKSELLRTSKSKRAVFVCNETCNQQCYTTAIDYPNPNDCNKLSLTMWKRGMSDIRFCNFLPSICFQSRSSLRILLHPVSC